VSLVIVGHRQTVRRKKKPHAQMGARGKFGAPVGGDGRKLTLEGRRTSAVTIVTSRTKKGGPKARPACRAIAA
jgi:hypothetical protein